MSDQLARHLGSRVRQARLANHQTQAVVAGLSGITSDYLYQIERGKKLPTLPVLLNLAEALRRTVGELLPETARVETASRAVPPAGSAVHRALTVPAQSQEVPDVDIIRRRINDAWRTWQSSPARYSKLAETLPTLITDTEAMRRSHGADQKAPHTLVVELYGLVRTVSKRLGRVDSALLAADRAVRASEFSGSALAQAAAAWNLAHVLLADGQPDGAEAVVAHALEVLRRSSASASLDGLALQGALLSVGAVAQVRAGNTWAARDKLAVAAKVAAVTGERNTAWTAFGPTNVAIHAVSLELETGEAGEALRLAERIEPPASLSIERRVAFLLDQAKGYSQRQDYHGALIAVQAAHASAPEDVSHRPAAHTLLQAIVRHGRSNAARQGAVLAERLGIPV
ncbi:helix-turn-helix domain-containing protein [Actinokineospora cianjurensis]|uniref:Helix-turn-helix protein n=1 Tax=Actinokineospora cianjurensis TaxID=585224 RepID=A0A421B6K3_9PSEU|nr:helix-turn-helix transcriptional regulator [Actinokineospora cianjurensis]RLK59925.1 helix-turn-helix protein [Actinokineospora cianjurensis]